VHKIIMYYDRQIDLSVWHTKEHISNIVTYNIPV